MTGPAAAPGRLLPLTDAWALTRAISPRREVRVAQVNAYGEAENLYPVQRVMRDTPPSAPWAVYLTDAARQFRLLCFDLDASKGDPAADAAALCAHLEQAQLAHVVTRSGPTGGRHVWLALSEPATLAVVQRLTHAAKHSLPTLDTSPMSNEVTGCVRPPGAPHRLGGSAEILAGDLYSLLTPTTTLADLERLYKLLAVGVPEDTPLPNEPAELLPLDDDGCPYLPGTRRDLPHSAQAALGRDTAGLDADPVLYTVLLGAIRARWHCREVLPLIATSPGLEHLRTENQKNGRRKPRTKADTWRVLRHQWGRAVTHVAGNRQLPAGDNDFSRRAAQTCAAITDVQNRAERSPGRWARPGGASDRRVLDALCLLAVLAITLELDADIRRLAVLTGLSRETVRRAYRRLQADQWIQAAAAAHGTLAASWRVLSPLSTESHHCDVSQGASPPWGSSPPLPRDELLLQLRSRLASQAHDVFTPRGGLGHEAGQLFALMGQSAVATGTLEQRAGRTLPHLQRLLSRLLEHRLVQSAPGGWTLVSDAEHRRDVAAEKLGIAGILLRRAKRYAVEREQWAWWNDELAWLRAPRRASAKKRPSPGQTALTGLSPARPAYPRTAAGLPDHRVALQLAAGPAPVEQPTRIVA